MRGRDGELIEFALDAPGRREKHLGLNLDTWLWPSREGTAPSKLEVSPWQFLMGELVEHRDPLLFVLDSKLLFVQVRDTNLLTLPSQRRAHQQDGFLSSDSLAAIVHAQKDSSEGPLASTETLLVELEQRVVACIANRAFKAIHDRVGQVRLVRFGQGSDFDAFDEKFLSALHTDLNLSVMRADVMCRVLSDLSNNASRLDLRGSWGSLHYSDMSRELLIYPGTPTRLRNFPPR
jgi:hypothetical protein